MKEIIWGEKNLTEAKMSCENKNELETNDITKNIKPELGKTECGDIGSEKKWMRNCPKCGMEIIYKNHKSLWGSNKRNSLCKMCYLKSKILVVDKNSLYKLCPKCNKKQFYKNKKYLNDAIENNSLCLSCSLTGKKMSNETKNKLRILNTGRKHTEEVKKKISIASKNMSDETRRKISIANLGRISPQLGNPRSEETKLKISNSLKNLPIEVKQKIINGNKKRGCSEETKEKMRLSAQNPITKQKRLEYLKNKIVSNETKLKMRLSAIKNVELKELNGGQLIPAYNFTACKYFDDLSKQNGWNLQHAENGGEFYIKELGYWVDGYDKDKNIVVEYNEPHHYWGNKKEKDMNRLNEIKNYLKCKFFTYNQQLNKLEEV